MLILMAFVILPFEMTYPGIEALTGDLALSLGELNSYLNGLQVLFVLDGIFLVGWLVSWICICPAYPYSPTCGSCAGLFAPACFSGGVLLKSPQIPD